MKIEFLKMKDLRTEYAAPEPTANYNSVDIIDIRYPSKSESRTIDALDKGFYGPKGSTSSYVITTGKNKYIDVGYSSENVIRPVIDVATPDGSTRLRKGDVFGICKDQPDEQPETKSSWKRPWNSVWIMIDDNTAVLASPEYSPELAEPSLSRDKTASTYQNAIERFTGRHKLKASNIEGRPTTIENVPIPGFKILKYGKCDCGEIWGTVSYPGVKEIDIPQTGTMNRRWIKFSADEGKLPLRSLLTIEVEGNGDGNKIKSTYVVVSDNIAIEMTPHIRDYSDLAKTPLVYSAVGTRAVEPSQRLKESQHSHLIWRTRLLRKNEAELVEKAWKKFSNNSFSHQSHEPEMLYKTPQITIGANRLASEIIIGEERLAETFIASATDPTHLISQEHAFLDENFKGFPVYAAIEIETDLKPGEIIPGTDFLVIGKNLAMTMEPLGRANDVGRAEEILKSEMPVIEGGIRSIDPLWVADMRIATAEEAGDDLCIDDCHMDKDGNILQRADYGGVDAPALQGPAPVYPVMIYGDGHDPITGYKFIKGEHVRIGDITWEVLGETKAPGETRDGFYCAFRAVEPIRMDIEGKVGENGCIQFDQSKLKEYLMGAFLYEHGIPAAQCQHQMINSDEFRTETRIDKAKPHSVRKDVEAKLEVGAVTAPSAGTMFWNWATFSPLLFKPEEEFWVLWNAPDNKQESYPAVLRMNEDGTYSGRPTVNTYLDKMSPRSWPEKEHHIRPVMEIRNAEELNLKTGDRFEAFGYKWTMMPDNTALCDDSIGATRYTAPWRTTKAPAIANDYQNSFLAGHIKEWNENTLQPRIKAVREAAKDLENIPGTDKDTMISESRQPAVEEQDFDPVSVAYAKSDMPADTNLFTIYADNGTALHVEADEPIIVRMPDGQGIISLPIESIDGFINPQVGIHAFGHEWVYIGHNMLQCKDLAPATDYEQQQTSRYATYQDGLEQALEAAREAEGLMNDMDTMMKMDPDLNEDDISRYIGR